MSNVVRFEPKAKSLTKARGAARSVTLFMHIRRATLIAHASQTAMPVRVATGRVGKS